jgi:predicted polyphosphate/ATP-dependent NAD kinase
MKVLVLLNESAGTLAASTSGDEPTRIRDKFAAHGVDAEVRIVEGAKLEETTRAAIGSDVDAVIAGGGDGTLNTIAAALAGSPKAFGVLPLGTHNHFAKTSARSTATCSSTSPGSACTPRSSATATPSARRSAARSSSRWRSRSSPSCAACR